MAGLAGSSTNLLFLIDPPGFEPGTPDPKSGMIDQLHHGSTIGPTGFEPVSPSSEPGMIDRYTTGLQYGPI